jgi:nucleoside-diphosphate-sugar epimerase
MTRVLVTGASGFVGSALCDHLAQSGYIVRAALRTDRSIPACVAEKVAIGDISTPCNLPKALEDIDSVIHLAARAHVLHDSPGNADLYTEINAHGTLKLAEAAAVAGVRRFVYLSSIKVNGEATTDHAYTSEDEPRPQDAYGVSKLLGERSLLEVAARTRMEIAIVRPPLVYGPGVRANFLRLLRWVDSGLPLPLGAIHNKRSLVSVWNLSSLLIALLKHPTVPNHALLVSDAEDLSTPELIQRIGLVMHRRVRLLPIPMTVLSFCGRLTGRKAEVDRLSQSLVVDISSTRKELGWSPATTVDESLERTVEWYREQRRSGGS